jgi:phosphoribosylformylglycinamidine cyclo-ligase
MGNLLEFYTDEITAQSLISLAHKFNIDAQIVGHVEAAEKNELIVTTEHGEFIY